MKCCWQKPTRSVEALTETEYVEVCGLQRSYTWLNSDGQLMSRKLTEYECELENDVQDLQDSLFSLTSHYAKIQFRLRQIATSTGQERLCLLHELERVICQGIDDNEQNNELPSLLNDAHRLGNVRLKQRNIIAELRSRLKNLAEVADTCFCMEYLSSYETSEYWPSESEDWDQISCASNAQLHDKHCCCIVCRERASAVACRCGYLSEIWNHDDYVDVDETYAKEDVKKKRTKKKKEKRMESKSPPKTPPIEPKSSKRSKSPVKSPTTSSYKQRSEPDKSSKSNSRGLTQRSPFAQQPWKSHTSARHNLTKSTSHERQEIKNKTERRLASPLISKIFNELEPKIHHMTLQQVAALDKLHSNHRIESNRSSHRPGDSPRSYPLQASKSETGRKGSRNNAQSSLSQLEVKRRSSSRAKESSRMCSCATGQQARARDSTRTSPQCSRLQGLNNPPHQRGKSFGLAPNTPRTSSRNTSNMRATKSCHAYQDIQKLSPDAGVCTRKSCLKSKPADGSSWKQVKCKFKSEPNLRIEYSVDAMDLSAHAPRPTTALRGTSSACGCHTQETDSCHTPTAETKDNKGEGKSIGKSKLTKQQSSTSTKSQSIAQMFTPCSKPQAQVCVNVPPDCCKPCYPVYPSTCSKYGSVQRTSFGRRFCQLICSRLRTQLEDPNTQKKGRDKSKSKAKAEISKPKKADDDKAKA
ncbi:uncharacterized protein LOC111592866 [Drosophila hydei]|uniref:Uncharacterized protein LOC111592866 n=1 Tax=Drosophila hydei TaxID=7224 RepID=A0A6J1L7Y0_DROHY|nr:uncharacterized protein LOC111592866 [Drosophila hydei]